MPTHSVVDVDHGGGVEADLGGLRFPHLTHRPVVEGRFLGLAGGEGCDLRGAGRTESDLVEVLLDLLAAIREVIAHLLVDPHDIGDALLHRAPLDTEPTGQLVTQMRLVEVPGCGGVEEQPTGVQGPPLPIGTFGHVGHQHVRVEVRVTCPAGAVPEPGHDDSVDLDLVDPVLPGPRACRLGFDVREGGVDRSLVRIANHGSRVGITETGEQRHGLRRPKRQIEPGDFPAPEPPELLARRRIESSPDRVEVVGSDFALEPELAGGGPGPSAGRFADAAVVLVD
jgi:hypothetical protein